MRRTRQWEEKHVSVSVSMQKHSLFPCCALVSHSRCVGKTAICRQGEEQFAFLSFYGTITGHFSSTCFVVQNSPLWRGSGLFRNRRKRTHTSGVGGGRVGGGGEGLYGIINYQEILLAHSCIFTKKETSFFCYSPRMSSD